MISFLIEMQHKVQKKFVKILLRYSSRIFMKLFDNMTAITTNGLSKVYESIVVHVYFKVLFSRLLCSSRS